MSTIPLNEIQKLNPSAIIELFVLDATKCGAGIFYFHSGTNELRQNIIWQGQVYVRYAIEASGFSYSGSGPFSRPTLKVSNFMSGVSVLLIKYSDLLGAKLIRKRTLKKYLDAANFINGSNPTEDKTASFPDDVFYIDRKVNESISLVEFELVSVLDLAGMELPRRQIIQNSCAWKYRGAECGYTGTSYFTSSDTPTSDQNQDSCSKRIEACKLRFGNNAILPFGGFPGAGLIGGK